MHMTCTFTCMCMHNTCTCTCHAFLEVYTGRRRETPRDVGRRTSDGGLGVAVLDPHINSQTVQHTSALILPQPLLGCSARQRASGSGQAASCEHRRGTYVREN